MNLKRDFTYVKDVVDAFIKASIKNLEKFLMWVVAKQYQLIRS